MKRYLDAWFPILATYNQRIIYLDGFCGPGRYKGGEDGSPIIAIRKALNHFGRLQNREITFIFIDERKDRIEHLKSEIASMNIPANFAIYTEISEFEKTVSQILSDLHLKNLNLAPTFAFIDPFGFKGIPFSLVKELLSNPKTEVFINIMTDFINRFVEHPDASTRQHIVDLFGTHQALQIIAKGGNRIDALKQLYQTQLETCAKYVRYFEMQDEHGRAIYDLFFASKHPLGFVKMKEAFWKVDPEGGFHFSDKTNPAQMIFVNSMSDLFHKDVPFEFIEKVFDVMKRAHWHQFQVLTKRAERVAELSPYLEWADNIWMGTSVENEKYRFRIDCLRQTGAKVKFLSLEPLIGPLGKLNLKKINWVIVDGESGPGARPIMQEWVTDIRDQCLRDRVPFFFKQWGGVQKKRAGRTLEGRTWDEMPVRLNLVKV